ncbi:unnamed protein product, partial [Cylicostephanus goldi]
RGIFPALGRPVGHAAFPGRQDGFAFGQGSFDGGARSYQVKGRLLCGVQGAQGARVSLYEIGNGGSPIIYEDKSVDGSGSFHIKAEIRDQGFGGGSSAGPLILAINHNCEGVRQMSLQLPQSYLHQGFGAVRTFDIGTINLEARYSGEKTNGFDGSDGFNTGGTRSRIESLRNGNMGGGGFAPLPLQA